MRILLFFLFFSNFISAQTVYPKDYFVSPLNIPLLLSGDFGELRKNHFHTGLDFKTQQREGLDVFASADGYISRIKISSFGYGKAIYIDHPNGFTTVYGHLSKANAIIEAYLKNIHYKEKAFEIEVFPKPNELVVKKGEIIAFSGNSGGSGGPHLHFEFRDTKTEKIINPMFFGFDKKIADTKFPIVNALIAYPIDENAVINTSQKPTYINLALQKDGSYLAEKIKAFGKIGFGISAYDMFDFSYNKNGLFKVETFLNGKSNFAYQFDTFGFDETRYVNALLDYEKFAKTGARIQKLFMKNPYNFSGIKTDENKGIITLSANLCQNYRIEVADFNNNKIVINVPIVFEDTEPKILKTDKKTNYFLKVKNDNNYKKDNISVFVPAESFYEDFYLNFDVKNDTLTFQDDSMPLQSNIIITFEDAKPTETEREKMFIASLDEGKLKYNFTKRKGNEFTAYTKNLGKFVLAKDTIAPKITPVNIKEGKLLNKQFSLQLSIIDSFSGIKEYNGFLNGKWVLFEYDYKTKKLTHYFDENFLNDGRNDLKVVVSDNVGNSTIFETYFFRNKQ
ncbi:MAG: M23 family metallopeptidase [Flavobacterium sp.]|nr:M23 family metallopeptidase [Flavobacterium sp.]